MRVRIGLVAVAATLMAACGSSSNSGNSMTSPAPSNGGSSSVTIVSGARTMTTTAYSPASLTVSVGTTVTWVNNDSTSHTATANSGGFDTGSISPGGQASKQFTSAGSFPYHCTFHPGMVATITVQ